MTLQKIAAQLEQDATGTGTVTLDDALLGSNGAFSQAVIVDLLRTAGNIILHLRCREYIRQPDWHQLQLSGRNSHQFTGIVSQSIQTGGHRNPQPSGSGLPGRGGYPTHSGRI
jgi:hypothetical protein